MVKGRFKGTITNSQLTKKSPKKGLAGRRLKFLSAIAAIGLTGDVCDACQKATGIADVLTNGEAMKRARKNALAGKNPYLDICGNGLPKQSVWEELISIDPAFARCFQAIGEQCFKGKK